ncbi:GntR family transcriptional regulator [Bacillus sp. FJAT-27251]|uniref:GntR family transcriptional regulator n=1 Tax=Bacillus sp. FJAT-27251 TaxID=1684142 RepID=UPI0006A7A936|nr:GntR family transcriptional regulator [Bacillus sp. FJAT-27251]
MEKQLSMAETVYQTIKQKIIYVEYAPGTLIREGELASELGISKTPVREALNGLKHEGLIEVIPYKGYLVSQLSFQELRDLFELRIILETVSSKLAIQRITKSQLDYFKRLAQKKFNIDSDDARKEFMRVNADFHCYLGEMSGNKQLADQLTSIVQKLQRGLFLASKVSSLNEMEEEHLELVDAIEMKNEARAKRLITKHIQDSQKNIFNLNMI